MQAVQQPGYQNPIFRADRKTLAGATLMACATFALIAPSAPAHALPTGSPSDLRPISRSEPAQPGNQRSMRPRAPAKSTAVGRTAPAANELVENATGPLQIIISLDKQELTLYAGGNVIARSRVSTGQRGYSTPTGVFSIIQKDRWHRSNLYDDAPMYFMQRITWSGVALHQGIVPNHPASHGCIRLPASFAQKLWGVTKLGVRVIIARGTVAPIEISHPHLFAPKREPAAPVVSQVDSLKAAEQAWTFAQLASKFPLVGATVTDLQMPSVPATDAPKANARPLKPGPVSVFISRKEGKLYVRKGFEPVFDAPVAIEQADQPFGTHVFTAMARNEDSATMRWTAVSMASAPAGSPVSAAGALDRITIPQAALDRISELMSTGASLIISDQGLGPETGVGTDFIVLAR